MNLSNNKILITGGATGIGLALTERFLQENNTVLICGRRAEVLKEVTDKHPGVIARVCDLTDEADRIALYEWVRDNHPDLNVLINNAGIQNWMQLSDSDFYEKAKTEVETNVMAPLRLSSLFLQLKSLTTIANVSSGLAFVQLTKTPVYNATKAFVRSFTLSLRHLVKSRGIEVIEIIPPALNTDLGGKGLHDAAPPVSEFVASVFAQLKEGKTEIAWGFSEVMLHATPEVVREKFKVLNPE